MYKASKDVINLLLDKDEDKDSIFQETCSGRCPLHIAVEQKAKKEVIELLLEAGNEKIEIQSKKQSDEEEEERSIDVKYKGMVGSYIIQ